MLHRRRLRPAAAAILLAVAGLSVASCGGGRAGGGAVERDSAGVRIVTHGAFPDARDGAWRLGERPALSVGSTDGGASPTFFRVTALRRLPDGRIAVANAGNHQVVLLTGAGGASAAYGRDGDGPGEYRGIGGLWVASPDTLFVYDAAGRITALGAGGRVLHATPVRGSDEAGPPMVRGRFGSGDYLAYLVRGYGAQARPGASPDSVTYGRYRSDDGTFQPLGRLVAGVSYVRREGGTTRVTGVPFAATGMVAVRGDGVWTAAGDRFVLDARDRDGRLVVSVRADATPAPVEEHHRERRAASMAGSDDPAALREARKLLDEMPVPATFPLIDRLLVDADENLWVREYLVDRDAPSHWRVFSSEGRYLSRVTTPAAFQVMEIGRDYVLGVARSELDEEVVQMFALVKGDPPAA